MIGAYSVSGNVIQGGGVDQYGNSSAIMNFEIAAQGMGAKYVLDGTDTCAAMFNPEGDAGDIEMWELICPMIYLVAADQAEHGRPRSPPRRLLVRVAAHDPEHTLLGAPEPRHLAPASPRRGSSAATRARSPTSTTSAATTCASSPRRERRIRSPTAPFAELALKAIDGERELKLDNFTLLSRSRPVTSTTR